MKVLVLVVVLVAREALCELGDSCEPASSSCRARSGEVCGLDGVCVCGDGWTTNYRDYPYLTPECVREELPSDVSRCDETCFRNAVCNNNSVCVCGEGRVMFGGKCVRGRPAEILERCTRRGYGGFFDVWYCNLDDMMTCTDSEVCHCLPSHYYNYNSDKCERKSDLLKANNLTEYRVKPGMYCLKNGNCIEGLECKHFKCQCPNLCTYQQKEEVCDCGKEEVSLVGPVLVGMLCGLIIVGFWVRCFQKLFDFFDVGGKDERREGEDITPMYYSPSVPPSAPASAPSASTYHNPSFQSQGGEAQPINLDTPKEPHPTQDPPPYGFNPNLPH